MPATIFQLLNKGPGETKRANTQHTIGPFCPVFCGITVRWRYRALSRAGCPGSRGSLPSAFRRGAFYLARCFTSLRGTRVSFETTATLRLTARVATRLTACAEARGTAVLLMLFRFAIACSSPFKDIVPLNGAGSLREENPYQARYGRSHSHQDQYDQPRKAFR